MKLLGMKINCTIECVILFLLLGMLLGGHLFCSCFRVKMITNSLTEGFEQNQSEMNNPWVENAIKYSHQFGDTDRSITANATSLPLPPGQLFMFDKNEFKPECCSGPGKNPYSSSTGCLCMTKEQRAYLYQRGGNRTMASDF